MNTMGDGLNHIKLVVFDLAGTVLDDSVDGLPLVTVAMKEAFQEHGITITSDQVNNVRGMEKKEAIKNLLLTRDTHMEDVSFKANSEFVTAIFKTFKSSLDAHLVDINREIVGATETFQWLREKGVQLAVGSGFPHRVVLDLVKKLGWQDLVGFASSAEHEGYGRPNPALIISAMKHYGIHDKRSVIKVGDTVVDIEEGKNAGCITVAVLTGTQSEEKLKKGNPDYIINSVSDLPNLLQSMK